MRGGLADAKTDALNTALPLYFNPDISSYFTDRHKDENYCLSGAFLWRCLISMLEAAGRVEFMQRPSPEPGDRPAERALVTPDRVLLLTL